MFQLKFRYLYYVCCEFVASFYMEVRDFYSNVMNNPIKATHYHLRMQKWKEKGGGGK